MSAAVRSIKNFLCHVSKVRLNRLCFKHLACTFKRCCYAINSEKFDLFGRNLEEILLEEFAKTHTLFLKHDGTSASQLTEIVQKAFDIQNIAPEHLLGTFSENEEFMLIATVAGVFVTLQKNLPLTKIFCPDINYAWEPTTHFRELVNENIPTAVESLSEQFSFLRNSISEEEIQRLLLLNHPLLTDAIIQAEERRLMWIKSVFLPRQDIVFDQNVADQQDCIDQQLPDFVTRDAGNTPFQSLPDDPIQELEELQQGYSSQTELAAPLALDEIAQLILGRSLKMEAGVEQEQQHVLPPAEEMSEEQLDAFFAEDVDLENKIDFRRID